MSNYYVQTVVHQSIPNHCMTRLERFLLCQIYNWEKDGEDALYFFAEESPSSTICFDDDMDDDVFRQMLKESKSFCPEVVKAIEAVWTEGPDIDADEIGGPEPILQAIVARGYPELPYISIEQAFTCGKMRPDGFGGAVTLITPTEVVGTSTNEWLHQQLMARGLANQDSPHPSAG